MAFTGNYVCSQFKQDVLTGRHDFTTGTGHTFKLALYPNTVTFTAATTQYTSTGETSGTGYTVGGNSLTIPASMPTLSGTTALADFEDTVWAASSFTARGAILYNSTPTSGSDLSVLVLDFLADKASTAGDFTIVFPGVTPSSAIIRIT